MTGSRRPPSTAAIGCGLLLWVANLAAPANGQGSPVVTPTATPEVTYTSLPPRSSLAVRIGSRVLYRDLLPGAASDLLKQTFHVEQPYELTGFTVPAGRLRTMITKNVAAVEGSAPGSRPYAKVSTLPLRVRGTDGALREPSMRLVQDGTEFVPEAPYVPVRIDRAATAWTSLGDDLSFAEYELATGQSVVTSQVRASLSKGGSGRFYDGLVQNADGTYTGIEVKSGSASLSASQRAFDEAVNGGRPAQAMLNGRPISITATDLVRVR